MSPRRIGSATAAANERDAARERRSAMMRSTNTVERREPHDDQDGGHDHRRPPHVLTDLEQTE